jgi:hypothetical protein
MPSRIQLVSLVPMLVLGASVPASAEETGTRARRPDLSGHYDGATLTPLQRPEIYGDNLYLTAEQAKEIEEAERYRLANDPTEQGGADREAPPAGGDGSVGAAGNVGGYNTFWIDRGDDVFMVDGKFRTSILIDPPNGRIPPLTQEARQARGNRRRRQPNTGTAWWLHDGDPEGPYDNMEQRPVTERCTVGFAGATPPLPSLYNNQKRIVQTEDTVMILIEMVHDARVVRMNAEHPPADVRKWMGDSIGWWEDDTLVVETTNLRPDAVLRGGSENMTLTERFSRLDDGNLLYNFTIDDPTVWTAPWTGEYVWKASDGKVYEYACHEGNYALGNIMRGARLLEADAMSGSDAD